MQIIAAPLVAINDVGLSHWGQEAFRTAAVRGCPPRLDSAAVPNWLLAIEAGD